MSLRNRAPVAFASERDRLRSDQTAFTMGVNIQKLFAAILTAMGFDNDTIAEEFQYARNAGNKK